MIIDGVSLEIIQGDITNLCVDAIVNAANNKLVMGGGVAFAIKKQGGKIIEDEALNKGPIKIGEAIVTSAGALKAKHVIHAAVMGMPARRQAGIFLTDEEKIRQATTNSLKRAQKLNLKSIAFPALGCGVGKFPKNIAAKIMSQEVFKFLKENKNNSLEKIIFVLYDKETLDVFQKTINPYLEHLEDKMQKGPFITVDAIIELKEGIVLIERKNLPLGWALPGGFVDYGESLEEAVKREIKEETNLDIENLEQFHTYSKSDRDPRFHTISCVFVGTAKGISKASSDAKDVKIVAAKDFKNINFAFDHKNVLEDYLEWKKKKNIN